jgi:hypothetical protein
MYNADRSGTITLLIDQESHEHQLLMTLANTDLIARAVVGPLVVTDWNTKEIAYYNRAFIASMPDIPKGVTAGVIPWRFLFETFLQQPFAFNANVVGN